MRNFFARKQKLLIGVSHSSESELLRAKNLISGANVHGAKSVALEMPFGTGTKSVAYFSDLERHAKELGMSVHHIDSPLGCKRMMVVANSLFILKNGPEVMDRDSADLSERISKFRSENSYFAPEILDSRNKELRFYEPLLKSIEASQNLAKTKSEAEIRNIFERLTLARSKIMLKRIRRVNPDLVIVGSDHLPHMYDSLKGYKIRDISGKPV